MDIVKRQLQIGLDSPVRLLHISDTHLAHADARDDERKRALADNRSRLFEQDTDNCRRYLKQAIDYAARQGMLLVHTGDLIDFVSLANLDIVREVLGGVDYFFIAGNHEFSKYVGEAFEDEAYKQESLPLVQAAFPQDIRLVCRMVGGVNLVGLDNTYYHFRPEDIARLREEAAKGLPIILLMHNPLYTPELFEEIMHARGARYASIMGCPPALIEGYDKERFAQQCPTEEDLQAIDYIKSEPMIKALLTGHMHFFHESPLSERVTQYVVGAHYKGEALEFEIT